MVFAVTEVVFVEPMVEVVYPSRSYHLQLGIDLVGNLNIHHNSSCIDLVYMNQKPRSD